MRQAEALLFVFVFAAQVRDGVVNIAEAFGENVNKRGHPVILRELALYRLPSDDL